MALTDHSVSPPSTNQHPPPPPPSSSSSSTINGDITPLDHPPLPSRGERRRTDDDDDGEDCLLALVRGSNPVTCIWSLTKSWLTRGTIRVCPNASYCSHDLSLSQQIHLAFSITLAKTFLCCFSGPFALLRLLFPSPSSSAATLTPNPPEGNGKSAVENGLDGLDDDAFDLRSEAAAKRMAKICVTASEASYDNEAAIKATVNEKWNMRFLQFFNCWNEYLQANTTQAFLFADKERDAGAIILAFRGTEFSNIDDWMTDFDISYYGIDGIGRVHVGFMEALGLATRNERETLKRARENLKRKAEAAKAAGGGGGGSAAKVAAMSGLADKIIEDEQKVLAYDAIQAALGEIMQTNPRAKLFITGHSLGGALAALFVAFMIHENGGDHSRVGAVFTFGMPRVGDSSFADFVEHRFCGPDQRRKFFRVVFRTDIVPRVPPDDPLFKFRQISPCIYYPSLRSEAQVLAVQPYNNLLPAILQPRAHGSAFLEFLSTLRQMIARQRQVAAREIFIRLLAIFFPGICAHLLLYYGDVVESAPSAFLRQLPPPSSDTHHHQHLHVQQLKSD